MQKLLGKTAIITGGTSGIGAASAELFAQHGAQVVVSGRNERSGQEVVERIRAQGGEAAFVACDVTREEDAANLIKKTLQQYGAIDILFNNAGVFYPSVEIERLPTAEWEATFHTNITGCFWVTRYAKEALMQSKGCILNTASVAGMQSYAAGRSYAYSASKAAVIQFSHMLAKNYAEEGIRVNCLCPGVIHTPMLHGRDPQIYAERIPMKRVGTADDVAKAALFLVSDDAAYLTGVVLPVDGGASL